MADCESLTSNSTSPDTNGETSADNSRFISVDGSDQLAGSVLFYNVYTSDPSGGSSQNARIALTNTSATHPAFVHLFFVGVETIPYGYMGVSLLPRQTVFISARKDDFQSLNANSSCPLPLQPYIAQFLWEKVALWLSGNDDLPKKEKRKPRIARDYSIEHLTPAKSQGSPKTETILPTIITRLFYTRSNLRQSEADSATSYDTLSASVESTFELSL